MPRIITWLIVSFFAVAAGAIPLAGAPFGAEPASADTVSAEPASAEPASAEPASADPVAGALTGVGTSVNDFTFDSFDAEYTLGKNSGGHATLETTETIVAQFPDTNQNHGIQRKIPRRVGGHPTSLNILSVKDGQGHDRAFTTEDDGDFTDVTIRDDNFVHGKQTYVIRYTELNFILFPTNSNDEEFYRDVNGTGWAQPFGSVSATLHVAPGLISSLTGDLACFQGAKGSKQKCDSIDRSRTGDGALIKAHATNLGPHENLTVVVGFTAGTFTPRDTSFFSSGFAVAQLIAVILAALALIVAALARLTRWRSASGRGTIVAQYEPPAGVNLLLASGIYGRPAKGTTAGLLDFAVRGNVRVLETDSKRKRAYELELITTEGLDKEEVRLAAAFFPKLVPGARLDLSVPSRTAGKAIRLLRAGVRVRAVNEGYGRSIRGPVKSVLSVLPWILMVASIAFGAMTMSDQVGGGIPVILIAVSIVLALITSSLIPSQPLTERGAELREYLKGLELYIGLAEADRLRFLQSPSGAERVDGGQLDNATVLRLYERLLPYATLFGQEKQWASVLGNYYESENQAPSWYSGTTAFNAAIFAIALSSFSTSLSSSSSSWSGSAGRSLTSGFGGGGFSGGGGGGGGGGGV